MRPKQAREAMKKAVPFTFWEGKTPQVGMYKQGTAQGERTKDMVFLFLASRVGFDIAVGFTTLV